MASRSFAGERPVRREQTRVNPKYGAYGARVKPGDASSAGASGAAGVGARSKSRANLANSRSRPEANSFRRNLNDSALNKSVDTARKRMNVSDFRSGNTSLVTPSVAKANDKTPATGAAGGVKPNTTLPPLDATDGAARSSKKESEDARTEETTVVSAQPLPTAVDPRALKVKVNTTHDTMTTSMLLRDLKPHDDATADDVNADDTASASIKLDHSTESFAKKSDHDVSQNSDAAGKTAAAAGSQRSVKKAAAGKTSRAAGDGKGGKAGAGATTGSNKNLKLLPTAKAVSGSNQNEDKKSWNKPASDATQTTAAKSSVTSSKTPTSSFPDNATTIRPNASSINVAGSRASMSEKSGKGAKASGSRASVDPDKHASKSSLNDSQNATAGDTHATRDDTEQVSRSQAEEQTQQHGSTSENTATKSQVSISGDPKTSSKSFARRTTGKPGASDKSDQAAKDTQAPVRRKSSLKDTKNIAPATSSSAKTPTNPETADHSSSKPDTQTQNTTNQDGKTQPTQTGKPAHTDGKQLPRDQHDVTQLNQSLGVGSEPGVHDTSANNANTSGGSDKENLKPKTGKTVRIISPEKTPTKQRGVRAQSPNIGKNRSDYKAPKAFEPKPSERQTTRAQSPKLFQKGLYKEPKKFETRKSTKEATRAVSPTLGVGEWEEPDQFHVAKTRQRPTRGASPRLGHDKPRDVRSLEAGSWGRAPADFDDDDVAKPEAAKKKAEVKRTHRKIVRKEAKPRGGKRDADDAKPAATTSLRSSPPQRQRAPPRREPAPGDDPKRPDVPTPDLATDTEDEDEDIFERAMRKYGIVLDDSD